MQNTEQQVDRCEKGNIFLEAAINTSEAHEAELQVYSELIEVCLVITGGTWSPTMPVQSSSTLLYNLDGTGNTTGTDSSTLG